MEFFGAGEGVADDGGDAGGVLGEEAAGQGFGAGVWEEAQACAVLTSAPAAGGDQGLAAAVAVGDGDGSGGFRIGGLALQAGAPGSDEGAALVGGEGGGEDDDAGARVGEPGDGRAEQLLLVELVRVGFVDDDRLVGQAVEAQEPVAVLLRGEDELVDGADAEAAEEAAAALLVPGTEDDGGRLVGVGVVAGGEVDELGVGGGRGGVFEFAADLGDVGAAVDDGQVRGFAAAEDRGEVVAVTAGELVACCA
ncbi:hypothetical protein ACFY04_43195 [Streptomyces sp. NPDC001549]|uniref:hypothetical protein n=1 Tax=Streptomyces sp. NPDC001549 TaxID=3364586 RepID=UPI0036BBBF24